MNFFNFVIITFSQFAIDATKNALADLETRERTRRDADALTDDDIQQRLQGPIL